MSIGDDLPGTIMIDFFHIACYAQMGTVEGRMETLTFRVFLFYHASPSYYLYFHFAMHHHHMICVCFYHASPCVYFTMHHHHIIDLWVLPFPLEDCSVFGNFVITLIHHHMICVFFTMHHHVFFLQCITIISQVFIYHAAPSYQMCLFTMHHHHIRCVYLPCITTISYVFFTMHQHVVFFNGL